MPWRCISTLRICWLRRAYDGGQGSTCIVIDYDCVASLLREQCLGGRWYRERVACKYLKRGKRLKKVVRIALGPRLIDQLASFLGKW